MTTRLDQRGTLDWPLRTFASLITEMRGGAPLKPSDFTKGGVKVVPKGGIGRTGWLEVEERDLQYCSQEFASAHRTNLVTDEYTLVVLRDLVPSGPSIGLIVQTSDPDCWILAQGVYGFKLNEDAEPAFLSQVSNTQWYRRIMNQIMVGSTQVHITNTAFKSISIPVPEIKEQRAIATALSDVDALIAGLEKLIAKKRDLKQAAMQQLLTGHTRLPGFSRDWVIKPLGDVAQIQKGQLITTETIVSGDVPVIAGGKKPAYFHNKPNRLGKTITVSASGASAGYVAFHRSPIFASDCSTISEAKIYCIEFMFFAMQLKQEEIYNAQTGGAQPHIQPKDLAPLMVSFPTDLREQEAIASVLCDMDDELISLESRLAKTRELKQGMMQELLTGRTRLV